MIINDVCRERVPNTNKERGISRDVEKINNTGYMQK